jgi:hypothetical protein
MASNLKVKVHQECPDGLVSNCFERLISPTWGTLKEIQFGAYSPPDHAILFYTLWSNYVSIPVVIILGNQNGTMVIQGWRGFLHTNGENEDSKLWYGSSHDNEFIALP